MGYQVYRVKDRYAGYGVPAFCEHPRCKEEIDRGVSYACGGEPFSEKGCDRYFCGKHLQYERYDGFGEKCAHEEDCECEIIQVCKRCAEGKPPFPYKEEHPVWVAHILKDKTWAKWRRQYPDEVKRFKKLLAKK